MKNVRICFLSLSTTVSVAFNLPCSLPRSTYYHQSHGSSHFELSSEPVSLRKSLCLPPFYTWLLLYAMSFSHQLDNYYFWSAYEHIVYYHLMHVSTCPSWSHGSSRTEILLFHMIACALFCVQILSTYWRLPLHPDFIVLNFSIDDLFKICP